jgi:hypothetical protein
MVSQLQGLLNDAITHRLVSPGVLAANVSIVDDWRSEYVQYFVVAKGGCEAQWAHHEPVLNVRPEPCCVLYGPVWVT